MKKIGTTGLKLLKITHITLAVMWIGGAFSMILTLLLTEVNDASSMLLRAKVLKTIDDNLIIIGANGCVITGLIYEAFTNWGFFKHRWIIAKWGLTVFMVLSGTFAMGPCVNSNIFITDIAQYTQNVERTIFWGWIQIVMLFLVIILSVWKPKFK